MHVCLGSGQNISLSMIPGYRGPGASDSAPPRRASTALAVKRGSGTLPAIQNERLGLGLESGWGPSIDSGGRFIPGFDATLKEGGSGSSGTGSKLAVRSRTGGMSMTHIVMFPTPTHAVPLAKGRTPAYLGESQSAPTLPQMEEQRHLSERALARMNGRASRTRTADFGGLTDGARVPLHHSHTQPCVSLQNDDFVTEAKIADRVSLQKDFPAAGKRVSVQSHHSVPNAARPDISLDSEEDYDDFLEELPVFNGRKTVGFHHVDSEIEGVEDAARRPNRRRTFHHVYNSSGSVEAQSADYPDLYTEESGSGGGSPTSSTCGSPRQKKKDPEIAACRQNMQREILCASGCGPEATFRSIDLNRNGQLSLQEFSDGMSRLCVKWEEVANGRSVKQVYKLFAGKDGVVRLYDLFPDSKKEMLEPNRISTPDFYNTWRKEKKYFQGLEEKKRGPRWQPADQDEELEKQMAATKARESATDRKRWMSQTIRRMKIQGKSDARCREVCASHLPRGSGSRDKESVRAFCHSDVKDCRRSYAEAVGMTSRNIQKQVSAMRDSRMELQNTRQELRRLNQKNAQIRKQELIQMKRGLEGLDIPEEVAVAETDFFDDSDDDAFENAVRSRYVQHVGSHGKQHTRQPHKQHTICSDLSGSISQAFRS